MRVAKALFIIVLLGLSLRVVHFVAIASTAYPEIPFHYDSSDMHAYLQWAERIRGGDWLGHDTYHPYFEWMQRWAPLETWHRWWGSPKIFHQAPLYPYLLAGMLTVVGGSVSWVLLVQLLLGALRPLLVYQIGRRLAGVRVGLLAAALAALYGPFVVHEAVVLRDWLPPLVEPLALLLLLVAHERRRFSLWLGAGVALGVAYLIKPSVVLFLPAVGAWVAWTCWSERRRGARACAGLALGFLLALAPLVARNVAVDAPPFAVSNRAVEALIVGNAQDGWPIGMVIPPSLPALQDAAGASSWAALGEVLGTWEGDWLGFAGHLLLKLRAVFDPLEVPNNIDVRYARELSPVLWATVGFGAILAPALAGGVVALRRLRRRPAHVLLLLYALATLAALLTPAVVGRYRLVLVPPLLIYAAVFFVWLLRQARARRWNGLAVALTACFVVGALQHGVVAVPASRVDPVLVAEMPEYAPAAMAYMASEEWDRALDEPRRFRAWSERVPVEVAPVVTRNADRLEREVRLVWAYRLLGTDREAARAQADLVADTLPPGDRETGQPLAALYVQLGDAAKARAIRDAYMKTPGRERPRASRD